MQKQAPSAAKILLMSGFALSCFGLLLFLWVAFGGVTPLKAKGYRFETSFGETTQLAQEADVRISGVSVGKVKKIEPNKTTGRANVLIELQPQYAPIGKDTKAILRQKTLLGETYVELTPGDGKKAGWVPDNGHLATGQISQTVELDEIFRTFDKKTRDAFDSWMQTQAVGLKGRGGDLNDALGNLQGFADDTDVLLRVLKNQATPVRQLVSNTGVVFNALSERDGQLQGLITNSNKVFETTSARQADLQDAFRALPTFEKEATSTVNRLTTFSKKTNPLVNQLRPAARELSPTLKDLKLLAPDLKALFRDLDPLIRVSRTGLPATQRFLDELRPLLGEFDPTLKQLNPILSYLGLYKTELNAFFANVVGSTEATSTPPGSTTPVHYLRTTNPLNAENLATYTHRLPTNRTNPYELPGAFNNLKDGLPSYETRQCTDGGTVPTFVGGDTTVAGVGVNSLVNQLVGVLPGSIGKQLVSVLGTTIASTAAPPCKQQGDFTINGKTSQFPQLVASIAGVDGPAARAAKTRTKKTP